MLNKKQIELTIIIVGIAILLFLVPASLKKRSVKKPPQPSPEVVTSPVMLLGTTVQPDKERLDAQKERAGLSWGRNPFSVSLDKEYEIGELQLKGISFSKDREGFAFINDEIVKKGGRIRDYEVIEVKKDKVLLRKGERSFYLTFPVEE